MAIFEASGYLPPGIHDMVVADIQQHFVAGFPTSTSRKQIFQGYEKHRSELATLGIDLHQLLGGSFISTKLDPSDIDLVCFADSNVVDNLPQAQKELLAQLTAGPETKASHLCDAYFCPTVPDTDPLFNKVRAARKYWMGEFGFDRQDIPKGLVSTKVP